MKKYCYAMMVAGLVWTSPCWAQDDEWDEPPDIHPAQEEREALRPIRETSNFRLVSEDITPPFLRDWKKRTDR